MRSNSFAFKFLEFYGTRISHRGQWWVHAKLRKWLQADVNAELRVVRDGHQWLLNPSDFVQTEFFWLGSREAWDVFHAKALVRPGCTIFDVGANFGHYAITLAGATGRTCVVHAFEPFPPNTERLRTNVGLNHLDQIVHIHQMALSDSITSRTMTTRADNSGAAHLNEDGEGCLVEVTTLDSFCVEQGIARLDFMKIDVEGQEEKLLRGGGETIRKFGPVIQIELDPPKLLRAGSSVDRLVSLLADLRYDLLVPERTKLVPLRELPRGPDYINVFCFPKARNS
jgi:FkbM family methyltransferase